MSDATNIRRASLEDAPALAILAVKTFIESHGHSASEKDIHNYISQNYNTESLQKELSDPLNIYNLALNKSRPVGFSKIILNKPSENSSMKDLTCLERIYLLQEYHGTGIGIELWNCILKYVREKNQNGIWLHVWIENHRAISFYKKLGFEIIGMYDFVISPNHTNPNHQMLLKL